MRTRQWHEKVGHIQRHNSGRNSRGYTEASLSSLEVRRGAIHFSFTDIFDFKAYVGWVMVRMMWHYGIYFDPQVFSPNDHYCYGFSQKLGT